MAIAFNALNRYSNWDGSQLKRRSAEDLMGLIADEVLESNDIQSALQSLLRGGMPFMGGGRMPGIQDMLRKLRQHRRQQLQRFNLDSVFDQLQEQLKAILSKEHQTIEDWLKGNVGDSAEDYLESAEGHAEIDKEKKKEEKDSNFSQAVFKSIAQRHQQQLEQLPEDIGGQIKSLENYEFLNTEAQKE
ncbi:MAG: hypothetical protein JKY67_18830, partial [Pseudomonadales bacterium]|nr:hypothetical protein [Pseudomonadales bacterium]